MRFLFPRFSNLRIKILMIFICFVSVVCFFSWYNKLLLLKKELKKIQSGTAATERDMLFCDLYKYKNLS